MRRYTLLLLSAALIALGGAAYGLKETVSHHYGAFAARFPHADATWWNPAESWRNKYENGNPEQGPAFRGSTTFLVFLTDAYHLFGELERIFTRCGFAILGLAVLHFEFHGQRLRMFLTTCLFMAVGWFVSAAGFHLVYTLFFRT